MKTRNTVYYATRETQDYFEMHLAADKLAVLRFDALAFRYSKKKDENRALFDAHVASDVKQFSLVKLDVEAEVAQAEYNSAAKDFGAHPSAYHFTCLLAAMVKHQNLKLKNTAAPVTTTQAIKIAGSVDWVTLYKDAGVKL